MNFRKNAVLALFATTLVASFALTARADSSAPVQLNIQSVCGHSAHLFDITNNGVATSSMIRYKITASASEVMPALYTWNLFLMPIAPNQTFQVTVPRAAWGLKVKVQIQTTPGVEVTSAAGAVSYPNLCW